nr:MAG TPA: hypothetical protein [Caudoviricetes sp.]
MSGCRFSVSHQSYGPATSSELSSPIVSGLYGPDKKKQGRALPGMTMARRIMCRLT